MEDRVLIVKRPADRHFYHVIKRFIFIARTAPLAVYGALTHSLTHALIHSFSKYYMRAYYA